MEKNCHQIGEEQFFDSLEEELLLYGDRDSLRNRTSQAAGRPSTQHDYGTTPRYIASHSFSPQLTMSPHARKYRSKKVRQQQLQQS